MSFPGKISRLPAELRDEICLQIYDGRTSAEILRDLNSRPEVKAVLARYFGGEGISAQNFSAWKQSGYKDWLQRRGKVQRLMELSRFAAKIAKNSKNLASSSAAILSGKVLEIVDELDLQNGDPKQLKVFISALSKLQLGELAAEKLRNDKLRLRHDSERLELEKAKFQRSTAEMFIKYAADEQAKKIALGSESKRVKMDKLVELMFGKKPEEAKNG